MANANAPFGLSPIMEGNGSPWSGATSIYYVPATNATALYIGDPVILSGAADADGVPTAIRATGATSARITGAVVGFVPSATIIANGYRAASTAEYAIVADGVGVLYEVQEDSVGGALTVQSVGLNANLVAGTGSRITGSGFMLDSSTAATSATLQVRVVKLQNRPDNAIGNYAKWVVRLNLPTEAGISSGVGV